MVTILRIDNREKELIKACLSLQSNNPTTFQCFEIKVDNLPIGDIILEKGGTEKIIVERKSVADLASSIKDGRYKEQSYRLNGNSIPNHNIIYLIEGDINRWKMIKSTLYSAMVSLHYFKGFSVMRSFNMDETAFFLCQMAYKIHKENDKLSFACSIKESEDSNNSENNREKNEGKNDNDGKNDNKSNRNEGNENEHKSNSKDYCSVIKKVKKENITRENIAEIMLCQIPGISSVTAIAIMKQFTSLQQLLARLDEDPTCMQNITYVNAKGCTRKINKNVSENIIQYLLSPPPPPAEGPIAIV